MEWVAWVKIMVDFVNRSDCVATHRSHPSPSHTLSRSLLPLFPLLFIVSLQFDSGIIDGLPTSNLRETVIRRVIEADEAWRKGKAAAFALAPATAAAAAGGGRGASSLSSLAPPLGEAYAWTGVDKTVSGCFLIKPEAFFVNDAKPTSKTDVFVSKERVVCRYAFSFFSLGNPTNQHP